MKTKLLLISLLTCTTLLQAQPFWEEITHPDSVWVWSLGVENPDFMLMGTGTGEGRFGGIYKSEYDTFDWVWKGPEHQTIYDIDMNSDGTIFISCHRYVYKSIDDGETWKDIYYYPSNLVSLEIDECDGIWVGFWGGILYSADGGDNWDTSLYTITDEVFNDFAFGANGEVYAVSQNYVGNDGGFYVSFDNGLNWENPGLNDIGAKTVEVNSENSIFVGSRYHGVFRSDDNGVFWENVRPYIDAVSLVIDDSDRIYFGADKMLAPGEGVHYSDDNGQTWDTIDQGGLTNRYVQLIYLGTYGHLYTVCHHNHGHQIFRSINPVTGIETKASNIMHHLLYPNPCVDYIKIESDIGISDNVFYSLHNLNGQRIINNQQLRYHSTKINTSYLNAGTYIINIYSENSINSYFFEKLNH